MDLHGRSRAMLGAWSSSGIAAEQPAEVPGVGRLATSLLFAHLE